MAVYTRARNFLSKKKFKLEKHETPKISNLSPEEAYDAEKNDDFIPITQADALVATDEINEAVTAEERSHTPIGHLEDAGSDTFKAVKSLFNTFYAATKLAYHTTATVVKFLWGGFGNSTAVSSASDACTDAVEVTTEGAKTIAKVADATFELGAAAAKAAYPLAKAGAYFVAGTAMAAVNGVADTLLDSLENTSESRVEEYEMTNFAGDSSDLFNSDAEF